MTPLATQPSRVYSNHEAGVRVEWYWLDEHADLLADAEFVLSPDEHARAERYHFIEDRTSYIISRVLLRSVLAERLSLAPDQIRLEPGVNGKPRLPDSGELCFNLSRSRNAVVIAVGERIQVGVDIECRDASAVNAGVVGWVLSPREYAHWRELPSAARCETFFTAWTRKEALLKGTGEGLNTPMSSVEVLDFDEDNHLTPGPVTLVRGSRTWMIVDLFEGVEYSAAVAFPVIGVRKV